MAKRTWAELAERLGVAPVAPGSAIAVAVTDPGGPGGAYDLAALIHATLDKLAEAVTPDEDPDLWVHGKSGNHYALVTDAAKLEWLGMQSPDYCVYVNAETGAVWIRPRDDFFGPGSDGKPRFTLVQ